MGLMDALRIGASGLTAQQAALQITGNNIANAATPGYARQVPELTATGESRYGANLRGGGGVSLSAVRRMVDEAVLARLRDANAQVAQYTVADQALARVEALMNEMTDADVSSALTELFNSFSALAQDPQDGALRGVVIQRAVTLADRLNYLRDGIERVRLEIDGQLVGAVEEADRLAGAIAELNVKVVAAESNGGSAASLRDQRDQLLDQLSAIVAINTREEVNGAVNVFIGSEPLVYHGASRGLKLASDPVSEDPRKIVAFADNDGAIKLLGGRITGLQATRDGELAEITRRIDTLAEQIIWQVNSAHACGTTLDGFGELSGTYQALDAGAALSACGLPFTVSNGSFLVSVTNATSGSRITRQIDVTVGGSGPQTTLNGVLAQLNAVPGVSASIDANGYVRLQATDSAERISFGEDSCGLLASLGLNTLFTGTDANSIAVNAAVVSDPGRIAAGLNGQPGDGSNAARLAALVDAPVGALANLSLADYQQRLVADAAVWTALAHQTAESGQLVQESLSAQRESLSGVSLDEEAVNLIQFQRAFQGSARFITVVNELMDTILQLV